MRAFNRLNRRLRSQTTELDRAAAALLDGHHGSMAPPGNGKHVKKNKPVPSWKPDSWCCRECGRWNWNLLRGSKTQATHCYATRECGVARGSKCKQWKDTTPAERTQNGGYKLDICNGAVDPKKSPTHRVSVKQPQPATPSPPKGAWAKGNDKGGKANSAPRAAKIVEVSDELHDARKELEKQEGLVKLCQDIYGPDCQHAMEHQTKADAATAEIERLSGNAAAAAETPDVDDLQDVYDRLCSMFAESDALVVAAKQKLEAAKTQSSPTANEVKKVRALLKALCAEDIRDEARIQEVRTLLDEKMRANGSSESDCYKSAEDSHKHAAKAVTALREKKLQQEAERDALNESIQETDDAIEAAVVAEEAAKKRLDDRRASISTHAPGVLQPADVQSMGSAMQRMHTVLLHALAVGQSTTGPGHITNDQLQSIADTYKELMHSAPSDVFGATVAPPVPQSAVVGGAVAAGNGGGDGSTAMPTAAATAVAAAGGLPAEAVVQLQQQQTQANPDVANLRAQLAAREQQRAAEAAAQQARAKADREADELLLRQALAAAAHSIPVGACGETSGTADGDLGSISADAIMGLEWGTALAA